jgi:DNA polymerase-3 subunit gamma/tau
LSYLVLARKYRPRTFDDLVGQEQVSRTLRNALATGRVAHAYLFSGPRGVGKTTAARLLAMSLSCLAGDVGRRPCGECENCLEIQGGRAVDVIEVDGASNRGINEIRDLRETVKYLPAKGRYKVYIIDEVHALTKDAFNALLKTLEEPPPHVVFIFATTETHKVLPTILSRCQRYDFRRIRVEDISARLSRVAELEGLEAEPEALEIIARQAEGGLRDSLSLMDQAIAAGGGRLTAEDVRRSLGLIDQALVGTIVRETLAGRAAGALAALDEAYLRGYDFKELGGKILERLRGLTLLKVDRGSAALLNITETEENDFLELARSYSLENLHRHFDAWLKFQRDLSYSPQPRWLLEAQVIRLAQLAPLMPVSELVEKLGRLLSRDPPPRVAPVRSAGAPAARSAPSRSEMAGPEGGPGGEGPEELAGLGWGDFADKILPRMGAAARDLLAGARAGAWSGQAVTLELPPGESLGQVIRASLEEELQPWLMKIFGARPVLTLNRTVPEGRDGELAAERLKEIRETPEARALLAELPGDFVAFLPGAAESPPEGESENGEELLAENGLVADSENDD